MSANSKQDLLDKLAKGDAMKGWGAMLAIGRDRFNHLLQTQFVEAFATQDFISPISGEYYLENLTEKVVFEDLMLGSPQLSFKQASGRSAQVIVSMELIAGKCSMLALHPGSPNWLRRSHVLQQGTGYQFELTAELKVVPIPHSDKSQLRIDWVTASAPTCNLGTTDTTRRAMGEFIKKELEQYWHAWSLPAMTVEYHIGYNAMSVVDYTVVTQKAPEGAGGGSSPADDGAVLLLMQLRGSKYWGDAPSEQLLYLLPALDTGGGNYGAAFLVNKVWATMLREQAEDLLAQVVLPQAYQIAMTELHHPHDAMLFGDILPTEQTRALQPAISSVGAFNQESFSLAGAPASAWSVRNLTYPRACGVIDKGRYTASAINEFATDQQVVVVTAQLTDAVDSKVRTALVVESSEALVISPRVVLWGKGDNPVRLTASHSDGVVWTTEGGNHGSIQPDPEDARYVQFVPGDQSGAERVVLQRVKATRGADSGYATVVILNYTPVLDIEPFHVARMPPSGTQTFALVDYEADEWRLFGAGNIDPLTGEYTAPEAEAGEVSVVYGLVRPHAGIAIIEHGRNSVQQMANRQERWRTLNRFEISRNNVNRNRVLANGLQQVGIDILIETKEFEGEDGQVWDPVSDLELSTLVLLHEDGTEVDFLPAGAEGLDPDEPGGKKWAVNKVRNRFDYLPTGGVQAAQEPLVAPVDARRIVTFYVNALEAEVRKFKAKFQDYRNGWHFSDVYDDTKGVVELEGVQVPAPNLGNYSFAPKRVYTEYGSNPGTPPDTFNYWHYTTDYWVLRVKDTQLASIHFDHASMIRWESELLKETYCTYTGFAFKPRRHPDAVPPPDGIAYGAELELLVHEEKMKFTGLDYEFKGQEGVSEGSLLVSLDRVPNMPYWYDTEFARYREVLDRPLLFTAIDSYGIAHRLKITFGGGADSRNSLVLELQ